MKTQFINKYLLILLLAFSFSSTSLADDLPNVTIDIDKKTKCVKEPDAWDRDYEHVVILVDRTSELKKEQMEWISDELFSKKYVTKYRPYTKFSIMLIDNKSPQLQEYIYSSCRPKTGKKSKVFADEEFSDDENENIVRRWFKHFLNGKKSTTESPYAVDSWLENKNRIGTTVASDNSFIFETFIRVLKDPSLDFDGDDYEAGRKIIIVSDLLQHSKDFSFYKICKAKADFNKFNAVCPSFEQALSKNKKLKTYLEMTKPKDVEGLEIELLFLNNKNEANVEIHTSLVNLWKGYFRKIGVKIPDDNTDWTNWQLNF